MAEQIPQTQLDNLVISNQNEALNVIAQFLHLAQRRGAFSLPESSKIYECLKTESPVISSDYLNIHL